MFPDSSVVRIRSHLARIYGPEVAEGILPRLLETMGRFARRDRAVAARETLFDETDVVLIAYGDQVREHGRPPLEVLGDFLDAHVGDAVTGLHLLPHYPSTSDDGFAVADYAAVDPRLGDWSHVERLAADRRLMLDSVVNHTSASHRWFLRSQCGDPEYVDYYIAVDRDADLRSVTRPRTSPLLTPTWAKGDVERWVWTTFSPDQIDLNYANPEVLLAVTAQMLEYLAHGAGMLRLDAVAFLWKQIGTSCVHLPETHEIVRLWRTVVDVVAPGTLLITETNVPHAENVSYFGDDANEAHLVYQFPLAPLTLTSFRSGDASRMSRWAASLEAPGEQATFFNFLGSHDGIGVRPVEGLVPAEEIAALCADVEAGGGRVSYRSREDGAKSPYELNASYFDALGATGVDEPRDRQVDRFLAAQSILLSLAGVPAVYFHALFGGRNWVAGADHTGQARTINRQRLARETLEAELADPTSLRGAVFARMRRRIRVRTAEPAFHPGAAQTVVDAGGDYFAVQRTPASGEATVLCVHDVSGRGGRFRAKAPDRLPSKAQLVDLCDGSKHDVEAGGVVDVAVPAYGVRWLRAT
ncbi:MAG: sugar phosphorylase [Stackebrandtia sp.]